MFATGGLFVGISYLLLLLYVLIRGIRCLISAQTEHQGILGLLIAAWIGLQAQSFISIDFIVLSLWSWVLAGAILGMANNTSILTEKNAVDSKLVKQKIDHFGNNLQRNGLDFIPKFISILILIPILILGVQLNRVEQQVWLNPTYAGVDNKEILVRNTAKILNNRLADPNYKFKSMLTFIDAGYFNEGAEYLKSLSTEDPENSEILEVLARIEKKRGNTNASVEFREKIAKLNPWNAKNYFELALLYKELGKKEEMFVIKSRILEIATSVEYSARAESDLN
jgi:tetratricopeptide (TPR) repeat protein